MGKDKEVKMVETAIGKYKKRMKKVCACGTIWCLLGILAMVIGIAFLAKYADYWGDDDNWRRHLPYAGVGLLIAGIVMIAIGVVFCVALVVIWKRLSGKETGQQFRPPIYEYGKAPYPQQPPWPNQQQGGPDTMPQPPAGSPGPHEPLNPNAAYPSAPADQSNVHIEVATHDKF